jgi:hypothetical protein
MKCEKQKHGENYEKKSGPDFLLTLNMKGAVAQQGTATVRFCRVFWGEGTTSDSLALDQISETLLQFSSIKKVVILSKDGHCALDQSGYDYCLR